MRPKPQPAPSPGDPYEPPITEPDLSTHCASCGREFGWDGLPASRDGAQWICGTCDQARTFDALNA